MKIRQKKMQVKYQLIEHNNSFHNNHWAVKLEEGTYEGIIYQYDTVSFEGGENNEDVILSFNTITLENPSDLDLTTEEFKTIIGDILTEIIEEQLESVKNGEDGTGDTEASAE